MRKLDCNQLILILADANFGPPKSAETKITKQTHFPKASKSTENKKLRKLSRSDPQNEENSSDLLQTFEAVHRVTALGRIFAEAVFADGARHFFAGEKLTYDTHSQDIIIEGTDAVPAYLDQIQCRSVRWNQETGALEADSLGPSVLAGSY